MATTWSLSVEERQRIETLIASFENHGCGMGLDKQAQVALRRLIGALDAAEQQLATYRRVEPAGDPRP